MKMKKHILFVHSSAELYGSDRSLLNIVSNINRDKFEVSIILPCKGPLLDELKKLNINVIFFDFAILRRKNLSFIGMVHYAFSFIKSLFFFMKFIKDNKVDVVYINTSVVFPPALAGKILHKKIIWHVREIVPNNTENFVISWIIDHFSDEIVVNSISTGDSLNLKYKNYNIVYNAVEQNSLERIKDKSNKNVVLGMAGRINRWKGQKLFVDIAAKVSQTHPNVEFKIAGSAYEGEKFLEDDLKKYISDLKLQDRVQLIGQVNDMDKFYSEIDIFILPSIQPEPFGLVAIEAMDAKIPVIATNHGGPREIITNSVDGFLVNPDDIQRFVDICSELIDNKELREEIGENGYLTKISRFSISTMINNIEKILERV